LVLDANDDLDDDSVAEQTGRGGQVLTMDEKGKLNDRQKTTLWIGLAVGGLMLLYPPWVEAPELVEVGEAVIRYGPERDVVPEYAPKSGSPLRHDTSAGYSFLFDPPPKRYSRLTEIRINWGRLLIQWVAVTCVTAFTISWCKQPGHRKQMDSALAAEKKAETPIGSHIPKTVLQPPELKELNLAESKQTDSKLSDLAPFEGLSEFEKINLTNSDLTDSGLSYLKGSIKLHSLYLSDTAVTDAGLVVLRDLINLRCLILAGTKITDLGLEVVEVLSKLETLGLTRTAITDKGLTYLGKLVNLRSLYLNSTGITDTGLESIKGLTELESLILDSTSISDKGIESLRALFKLRIIWLGGTRVTDAGLVHLNELTNLRWLSLNDEITDLGLVHTKGFCQLQDLSLGRKITDAGLVHLKQLTNLRSLLLAGPGITDAGMAHLKQLNLRRLALYETQVSETGIKNARTMIRDIQRFKRTGVSWEEY